MSAISVEKMGTIDAGRQGENLARTIEFDVSSMLAKWPGAKITLLVKRKGDPEPYFAEAKVEGNILKWPITEVETAVAGDGKIEIQAILGEVIEKSVTATFRVSASLSGSASEELPEVRPSWVDEVLAAAGGGGSGSGSGEGVFIVTATRSNAAASAYRPVMYLNYISHAGLEGWWQYEQMGAGRAGTVYADLFNGNMVLEHSDTAMSGNRMPVSVNHYYNSCLSDDNNYNCGYGWKTDAHQKVTGKTYNGVNYYVWEDGDGTEHYFQVTGSQPYKDCEGMEMELTYTSGSPDYIIITDKEHNQMRFNVVANQLAWLVAARDACHNTVTYSYVSGHETAGRIDTITDPVGRVTKFNYSGSLLSNIRIPAANGYRYVYFTYDSSNRLTGVRYSELGGTAAHTTYTYEGSTKLLTKARNYDGIQVNVEYEAAALQEDQWFLELLQHLQV